MCGFKYQLMFILLIYFYIFRKCLMSSHLFLSLITLSLLKSSFNDSYFIVTIYKIIIKMSVLQDLEGRILSVTRIWILFISSIFQALNISLVWFIWNFFLFIYFFFYNKNTFSLFPSFKRIL